MLNFYCPSRHCLWILGNGTTLASSGSVWEAVVHDAQSRQCFFCADEDKDLGKAILEVKEELGELDDLLCRDSLLFKTCRWKVYSQQKFVFPHYCYCYFYCYCFCIVKFYH